MHEYTHARTRARRETHTKAECIQTCEHTNIRTCGHRPARRGGLEEKRAKGQPFSFYAPEFVDETGEEEARCLAALLVQADANVDGLRKSLKFSNLLNTLVRSYGSHLRPHIPAVRHVAERLETFMKKNILAAVAKLSVE